MTTASPNRDNTSVKVFISWSGERSQAVGLILRTWLPKALQQVQVFHSDEDLQKGTTWSYELAVQLAETKYGLIVLTRDNQHSPWLNYEAGALSKTLPDDPGTRVNALLMDLEPADVVTPLKNFQNTVFRRADFFKTFKQLNHLTEAPLDEKTVTEVFSKWWPELDREVREVLSKSHNQPGRSRRPTEDVLDEILELTRRTARSSTFRGPAARGFSNSGVDENVIFPVDMQGRQLETFDEDAVRRDVEAALGLLGGRCAISVDTPTRTVEVGGPALDDLPRTMQLKLRSVANRHAALIIFGN